MKKELLTIVSLLAIGTAVSQNNISESKAINQEKHIIYDTITNTFNNKPGGIDEQIMSVLSPIMNYPVNTHLIKMGQAIDEIERQIEWKPLNPGQAKYEIEYMKKTIEENFKILERLDETNLKDVKDEEKNLKRLMIELDEFYQMFPDSNDGDNLIRALASYETISKAINEETTNISGTKNLIYMTNNKSGDCTENTASQYCLLNFYKINTYLKFGKIEEDSDTTHTWITVNPAEFLTFDLDPRHMVAAIPLEVRNPQIEFIQYKELHIYKKSKIKTITPITDYNVTDE